MIDRPPRARPIARGGTKALQSDTSVTQFERTKEGKEIRMLWTIAVILIVLWLLGLVSSYTMGGFIHLLLVVAIIVVLINVIQGRRAIP